jgi:hypothetical protein
MRLRKQAAMFAVTIAVVFGATQTSQAVDKRLFGAWIQSPADCAKTFQLRGGRLVYREPRDQFSISFVIAPGAVLAPGGDCRVESAVTHGDVTRLSMTCSNGVGYARQTAQVKTLSPTTLLYSPTGDPDLAATYQKCPR